MARENWELAYIDRQNGMARKDIADKYGVSINTVDSWRKRKWGNIRLNTVSESLCTSAPVKRKSGAPVGSKNALGNPGGAAPINNKNAVVTGEYESLLFDTFDDTEKELVKDVMSSDKLSLIKEQLALAYARQHRILRKIQEYKNQKVLPVSIEKSNTDVKQRFDASDEKIMRCEAALTRVQDSIQKLVLAEHKMLYEDKKTEIDRERYGLNKQETNDAEGLPDELFADPRSREILKELGRISNKFSSE